MIMENNDDLSSKIVNLDEFRKAREAAEELFVRLEFKTSEEAYQSLDALAQKVGAESIGHLVEDMSKLYDNLLAISERGGFLQLEERGNIFLLSYPDLLFGRYVKELRQQNPSDYESLTRKIIASHKYYAGIVDDAVEDLRYSPRLIRSIWREEGLPIREDGATIGRGKQKRTILSQYALNGLELAFAEGDIGEQKIQDAIQNSVVFIDGHWKTPVAVSFYDKPERRLNIFYSFSDIAA